MNVALNRTSYIDLNGKTERSCPACECQVSVDIKAYSECDWRIVSCIECDFVYLKNSLGYEALIDQYSWEKTSTAETQRRLKTRNISAKLSKKSQWRLSLLRFSRTNINNYFTEGNVLDLGCGSGHRIVKTGGIPHGVEISSELHKVADEKMRKRGGYCIHAPAIEGVSEFPDEYFKSVLMHSFLEHEENPVGLLSELYRILQKGGNVYIRVPNYASINRKFMGKKWCGFRYPDHVNYFTADNLKRMVMQQGFAFKLLNPVNLLFDDNIKALLTK